MIAAAIAAVVAQALTIAHAELELAGPLRAFEVSTPRSTLIVDADLAAGERRRAVVPVPTTSVAAAPEVRALDSSAGGRAGFVAWADGGVAPWDRFPPALRARPRGMPDGSESGTRPPLSALLLAAAWLPLALAVKRRPAALAAGALATAATVAALVAVAPLSSESVRVLEGDLRGTASHGVGAWLDVLGSRNEVAVHPRRLVRVEAGAEIRARIELAVAEQGPLWISAPGSTVFAFSTIDPGERQITAAANGWGDLDLVWTRTAGGEWSEHGSWRLGAALPPGETGPGTEPPGWLNPALPMGTGVLIARAAQAERDAAGRPCGTWLRLLGFGD